MSNHETDRDIETQRQIQQSAHESEVFEQSDAAKVAAVAAVCEAAELKQGHAVWSAQVTTRDIRTALVDPDAALERVRAEARAEALPSVEVVAAKVHEAWMKTKREQGVTSRPSEWGEEQMVPYADLSERAKDLDRSTVLAVFDAIKAVTPDV
ncbi:RyR domain-containing protein [Aeromicrobium sp. 9AM]|uniref:RyR domain-containing protein n=1 Tax=Aeromicrobium sp. 9AM TaxID=2653126 RepID=UPI0013596585|nr:RyR domain-containing protein [Aeromicrobium sp. 9AM]